MNTHETYVSLEVAKLLKDAGFNWECMCYYTRANDKIHAPNNGVIAFMKKYAELFENHNETKLPIYSAPTLEVAQRWLREIHHLHITIFSSSQESWMFRITKQHQNLEDGVYGEDFYTYEEAQEAGIRKCLTILLED